MQECRIGVSTKSGRDHTILHIFIANECHDVIMKLLKAVSGYINPNIKDAEGKTILILASKMTNTPLANQILSSSFSEGIDINATDKEGCTALHYACALGNLTIVKLLLQHQANPNIKNNNHQTAFEMAHLSEEPLRHLFLSVSLNPDRDIYASRNIMRRSDIPEMCIFTKMNVESQLSNIKQLIQLKKQSSGADALSAFTLTNQLGHLLDEQKYLESELKKLSGQSLLEQALKGQKETQQFVIKITTPLLTQPSCGKSVTPDEAKNFIRSTP